MTWNPRPYLALARATARSAVVFRLQFALSLFSVLFQLVAMLAVWHALLSHKPLTGFTWPKMEVYLLVTFTAGAVVSNFSDFRISYKIRNGQVALDLVKPLDYQRARLAETVGGLGGELLSVLLVWAVGLAFGVRLDLPALRYLALFAVSLVLLVLLKFTLTYLTGLLCFWTKNYLGIYWARLAIVSLLSGALVPLSLLPHWLGETAQWLPFAGMTSTPGLLLIGNATGGQAYRLVAVQLVWAVLLWPAARLAWRGAMRQVTIQGG